MVNETSSPRRWRKKRHSRHFSIRVESELWCEEIHRLSRRISVDSHHTWEIVSLHCSFVHLNGEKKSDVETRERTIGERTYWSVHLLLLSRCYSLRHEGEIRPKWSEDGRRWCRVSSVNAARALFSRLDLLRSPDSKFCSAEIHLMYTISVHCWYCSMNSREARRYLECKTGSFVVLMGGDFLSDLFDYYSSSSSLIVLVSPESASRDSLASRAVQRDDLHADQRYVWPKPVVSE